MNKIQSTKEVISQLNEKIVRNNQVGLLQNLIKSSGHQVQNQENVIIMWVLLQCKSRSDHIEKCGHELVAIWHEREIA